ncbi:TPA: oligosaccharide flippase family protein [Candidatus Woesearchaeota archaeon]|nr:oligosaccharide flippase family protein [Candidatus Woesearchaeota archaeon]HIH55228.1 oligosaccharide flippase family protein [Candidatus Woesearchaeota archaeon]HIJ01987.1 oligosaccharide flippase family protein [Candidatus Woesearchaeota archaeon]HIJ14512.1 oligosaccharide flippase family protein [Candidatus Woesearchaeota archaeon]
MDPERAKNKIDLRIFSSDILKNILTVSYNSLAIAILTLVFHLIMSRKLGPGDYGTLVTLLSINSIVLLSLSAVGFVVARFISYYRTREQYDNMKFLAQWAFMFFLMLGLAGFLINIILSQFIADFLNIDHNLIILFGIIIWISFLMPIIDGILRGLQEFRYLGRYKLADAMLKLITAAIIVYIGFGLKSVIAALILSSIIILIISVYILKRIYITKPHRIKLKEIYKFTVPVFISMICLAALSNIDLVLVKHFFDEIKTGNFAAAGILAKLVFGIALGSAGVLFPKIVEYYSNGRNDEVRKNLQDTLKIVITPGIIITLLFVLFPSLITNLFFGRQYDIDKLLPLYSIALFFLSICAIFIIYNLAVKKYAFIPIIVAFSGILTYQIIIAHKSLMSVIWALFAVDFILLVFFAFYNKEELITFFSS